MSDTEPARDLVVRPSRFFTALFALVGIAMIVERFVTGDGQLVAGLLLVAAGSSHFFNRVVVGDGELRIETPRRRVRVAAPQIDPTRRQYVRDGETGEPHRLPIGMWVEDIRPALTATAQVPTERA